MGDPENLVSAELTATGISYEAASNFDYPCARMNLDAAIEQEAMQTGQSDNAGVPDLLERLRELGKLKGAGYLTEEEFQLLKKKVIASQT